jgi:hypothetical protein
LELRDLIAAPLLLLFLYATAYFIRPFVTNEVNRRYFLPGLTVRIVGALALGFIYQFYYHGGDTYNFHTHGSRHIWEAFWDSPDKGFKLLFSDGSYHGDTFRYASRIPFFRDKSSYTVIKIAAFFDLFTFSSYAATALFFAVISFIGSWSLFLTFYDKERTSNSWVAIVTLFMPSVFFWGSGLLKDTISLACISIATYLIKTIFIEKRWGVIKILILALAIYLTLLIKMYILLCYIPAAICWVATSYLAKIKSRILQLMVLPFGLVFIVFTGYTLTDQIGNNDKRYKFDALAETSQITAYDIAYMTGFQAGSTYSLGELDGTFSGMVKLAPQAVNVSLFRPYLWEVRNPLMLMTSLESLSIFLFMMYVLIKSRGYIFRGITDPKVIFCLIFSLTFAFAVGVSTFNFGTLSRYKIPLIPFFLLALILIYQRANNERKLSALALTE